MRIVIIKVIGFCFLIFSSIAGFAAVYAVTWYDRDHKVTLYQQPNLYGMPVNQASETSKPLHAGFSYVGKQGHWKIFKANSLQSKPSAAYLPLYSTEPDWKHSVLYGQAEGVVIVFKNHVTESTRTAWFKNKNYSVTQLSMPNVYVINNVTGRKVIEIANECYHSDLMELAEPNWVSDTVI